MNAQERMAQIISYVCETVPGIALEKKWNRLLRDFSKELELLEELANDNAELRARVEAAERAMQEAKNALEPHHIISNNGTGIMAAYNILAAALAAKGAG